MSAYSTEPVCQKAVLSGKRIALDSSGLPQHQGRKRQDTECQNMDDGVLVS